MDASIGPERSEDQADVDLQKAWSDLAIRVGSLGQAPPTKRWQAGLAIIEDLKRLPSVTREIQELLLLEAERGHITIYASDAVDIELRGKPWGFIDHYQGLPSATPLCDDDYVRLLEYSGNREYESILVKRLVSSWENTAWAQRRTIVEALKKKGRQPSLQALEDTILPRLLDRIPADSCKINQVQPNEGATEELLVEVLGVRANKAFLALVREAIGEIRKRVDLARTMENKPQVKEASDTDQPNYTDEADRLTKAIEEQLHDWVLGKLKKTSTEWWNDVPEKIRNECNVRMEGEKNTLPKYAYLNLIDYRDIIRANWELFMQDLKSITSDQGKDKATSWLVNVNAIRIICSHKTKQLYSGRKISREDVDWLSDITDRLKKVDI